LFFSFLYSDLFWKQKYHRLAVLIFFFSFITMFSRDQTVAIIQSIDWNRFCQCLILLSAASGLLYYNEPALEASLPPIMSCLARPPMSRSLLFIYFCNARHLYTNPPPPLFRSRQRAGSQFQTHPFLLLRRHGASRRMSFVSRGCSAAPVVRSMDGHHFYCYCTRCHTLVLSL
jgi:hypothetical protein